MSFFANRFVVVSVVCLPFVVSDCAVPHTNTQSVHPQKSLATPTAGSSIHWFHDDYAGALAQAQKTNRPLVIDFWAKWCHTCLSMQQTILTDPSFTSIADRFVWLALDTDLEKNAPLLTRFPISAWPTFIILSGHDESIQAQYQGAASVAQFRAFLKTGEQAHLDQLRQRGQIGPDDPLYYTRQADRFALAKQLNQAALTYAKALALAPNDWERRPDVLTSLISVLARSKRWSECVDLALNNQQYTGNSASAADFAYFAMTCASKLTNQPERSQALLLRLENRLKQLISDKNAPLAVDDRSEAMRILRAIYLLLDDKPKAQQIAVQQQKLLDQAAAQADNPTMAATYNWPRAEVYVYLGQGKKLLEDLRKSTAALPTEFDPPYRAAWVALQIGELDRALAFAKTSLARAYGPRKGRIYLLISEIHKQNQESKAVAETLQEAIAYYHQLPAGQQQPNMLTTMKTLLNQVKQDTSAAQQHEQ